MPPNDMKAYRQRDYVKAAAKVARKKYRDRLKSERAGGQALAVNSKTVASVMQHWLRP